MTEAEANEALERIGRIVESGSEPAPMAFGAESEGGLWAGAGACVERAWRAAGAAVGVLARTEHDRVGTVVTDWTADMYCVWEAGVGTAEQGRHLEQFQRDFTGRLRAGYLLAAAVRAALALSRLAAAPLTVVSAARAAWDLVAEVQKLRASMESA